ncbi:hypothetical protein [Sphingobium phenoxybenzoativorans]|uniref:hypothetical protein n=1 Tax=Sphingobium phenoxybenzoativorans TaxID=1592790 RepID=UPI000872E44E|nr:hypothetical protein [Sphingobium phenoxybenzoativorans]
MAHYLQAKAVSDDYAERIHNPVYKRVSAIQPEYRIKHVAKDGSSATYRIPACEFAQYEIDENGFDFYAHIRPKIEELKTSHARYEALCRRLDYYAINDRMDALAEQECDAAYELMQTPAPHWAAVTWKMDYLFGPEACGKSTPCYNLDYVQPFFDDVKRLGGAA